VRRAADGLRAILSWRVVRAHARARTTGPAALSCGWLTRALPGMRWGWGTVGRDKWSVCVPLAVAGPSGRPGNRAGPPGEALGFEPSGWEPDAHRVWLLCTHGLRLVWDDRQSPGSLCVHGTGTMGFGQVRALEDYSRPAPPVLLPPTCLLPPPAQPVRAVLVRQSGQCWRR
jgi:hypothetical protein